MAETWVNTPFKPHGRSRNGCDCIGLIIGVLYENNIMSEKDFIRLNKIKYGTNLSKIKDSILFKEMLRFFKLTQCLHDADILLMRTKNSPLHFAIHQYNTSVGSSEIIHATNESNTVCKTNLDDHFHILSKFVLLKNNFF